MSCTCIQTCTLQGLHGLSRHILFGQHRKGPPPSIQSSPQNLPHPYAPPQCFAQLLRNARFHNFFLSSSAQLLRPNLSRRLVLFFSRAPLKKLSTPKLLKNMILCTNPMQIVFFQLLYMLWFSRGVLFSRVRRHRENFHFSLCDIYSNGHITKIAKSNPREVPVLVQNRGKLCMGKVLRIQ